MQNPKIEKVDFQPGRPVSTKIYYLNSYFFWICWKLTLSFLTIWIVDGWPSPRPRTTWLRISGKPAEWVLATDVQVSLNENALQLSGHAPVSALGSLVTRPFPALFVLVRFLSKRLFSGLRKRKRKRRKREKKKQDDWAAAPTRLTSPPPHVAPRILADFGISLIARYRRGGGFYHPITKDS